MKVALFGASGMIGSRILRELVRRGHTVTAVARNPGKIQTAGVQVLKGDATDAEGVAAAAKGAEAAISAYAPPQGQEVAISTATQALLEGLERAGVKRFLMVGGAAGLEVAPGLQLLDAPDFPTAYKAIGLAHREVLPILKQSTIDWSYLSPAAIIQPGERTGKFRLGGTKLVVDEKGESRISAEDYAIALVDELDNPKHGRRQFTVAC